MCSTVLQSCFPLDSLNCWAACEYSVTSTWTSKQRALKWRKRKRKRSFAVGSRVQARLLNGELLRFLFVSLFSLCSPAAGLRRYLLSGNVCVCIYLCTFYINLFGDSIPIAIAAVLPFHFTSCSLCPFFSFPLCHLTCALSELVVLHLSSSLSINNMWSWQIFNYYAFFIRSNVL